MNRQTMEEFRATYGMYGYNDFTKNIYKRYYKRTKAIVFDSNINRVNTNEMQKIADLTTTINFDNYPYRGTTDPSRGILGIATEVDENDLRMNSYSAYFSSPQIVEQLQSFSKTFQKHNCFIRITDDQAEGNKQNTDLQRVRISFSLHQLPNLEYMTLTKEICQAFFHRFIVIDWTDSNAYGERGDYMPFGWGLSWGGTFRIEKVVHTYLNESADIPYSLWHNIEPSAQDLDLNRQQILELSHIIDQHRP